MHGDWWAGKGVGLCRIDHPLATVDFYLTHLHANYTHTGYDVYTGHRVSQMYNMAKLMMRSSADNAVISVGDFNCVEDEVATDVFREASGLTDSYRELYPDRISYPGYTNDTPECSWRSEAKTAKMCSNGRCKRIDYVFYNKDKLSCTECEITCGKIPGKNFSYSDHMGVVCTFTLNTKPRVRSCNLSKGTVESALECIDTSLHETHSDAREKLILWVLLMMLWGGILTMGHFKLVSAPVVGVLSSAVASIATVLFWYLVIFIRTEISKFSEARNQLSVSAKFAN